MCLDSQNITVTVQRTAIALKNFRLPKLSMNNPVCEFLAMIIDVAVQLASRDRSVLGIESIASMAEANLMGKLRAIQEPDHQFLVFVQSFPWNCLHSGI
jgi:hypothetical protein